ncbi:general stress protein [Kribbella sp. NPDC004875]|uniref:general stress protein n=1 Tax=Kribbella sp. NPDC004875 TaxID=3364107 RepID=UPI0036BDA053
MPTGQASGVPNSVIAAVSRYDDAQRTVDYLRSFGMDARSLEVVGAGLRQVSRRRPVPVVKLTALGALQGALLGVLTAVFITLVAETTLTGLAVVVWGFVYGVLVGTLWGLFRGLVRNRPDLVSTEILPTHYEVRCPSDELSVAQTLLADAADVDDGRVERGVIADAPHPPEQHRDAA